MAYRHLAELPLAATYLDLRKQIEDLRNEVNDILADQNDINESTRAQLDAISTALAELQSSRCQNGTLNKRRPIGFIQPKEDEEDSGDHEMWPIAGTEVPGTFAPLWLFIMRFQAQEEKSVDAPIEVFVRTRVG